LNRKKASLVWPASRLSRSVVVITTPPVVSLRLVLTPQDPTGRIAVEFAAFLEFSLEIDIELEALVERTWENDLRRTAGRRS